jgi:hypothetical protein
LPIWALDPHHKAVKQMFELIGRIEGMEKVHYGK